jgi:hypothetical protein
MQALSIGCWHAADARSFWRLTDYDYTPPLDVLVDGEVPQVSTNVTHVQMICVLNALV